MCRNGSSPQAPGIVEKGKAVSTPTWEGEKEDDETPSKKVKRNYTDVYVESLLEKSKTYRYPYRKLVSREWTRRVYSLAQNVLAACVDRSELKEKKDELFKFNKNLAQDALTILDEMKTHIQCNLKININLR